MANFTTTSDLKKAVLQHCGELTTGTSKYDATALEYLNRVYQELLSGENSFGVDISEPWPWAKLKGILVLNPPYTTGTITLTQGSTAGTFSSAPAASQTGKWLIVTGETDFAKIETHTAGSASFTLDAAYTETGGAGLSYTLYELEYDLSAGAISRLIEPMIVYRSQSDETGKIYSCSPDVLTDKFPLKLLEEGTPSRFAIISDNDGTFRVRFNRSVEEATRVEYEYIPVADDLTANSTPLVPRQDRIVLTYGATYFLMLDKNDSRSDYYYRLTQSKLQSMLSARRAQMGRVGANFGRMLSRQEDVATNGLQTESGIEIV